MFIAENWKLQKKCRKYCQRALLEKKIVVQGSEIASFKPRLKTKQLRSTENGENDYEWSEIAYQLMGGAYFLAEISKFLVQTSIGRVCIVSQSRSAKVLEKTVRNRARLLQFGGGAYFYIVSAGSSILVVKSVKNTFFHGISLFLSENIENYVLIAVFRGWCLILSWKF